MSVFSIMQHIYPDFGRDRRKEFQRAAESRKTKTHTMKYFALLLMAAVLAVEAAIPDYIHICKRNDPQINKCIENSILNMRTKLIEGIPELEVPKLDPMVLDELILNLGPGVKAQGRNLLLSGGKNFKIDSLSVNLETDTYGFGISFPEIVARGEYEIDATIAAIPLKGKGPINLIAKTVSGQGTMHGKKVVRGGKTLYYFPSMDLKLEIKDYEIKLENLFEGDAAIGEVTNKLLNEQKTSVLNSLLPGIEKAVVERLLLAGNNICKHFTFEELFPAS